MDIANSFKNIKQISHSVRARARQHNTTNINPSRLALVAIGLLAVHACVLVFAHDTATRQALSGLLGVAEAAVAAVAAFSTVKLLTAHRTGTVKAWWLLGLGFTAGTLGNTLYVFLEAYLRIDPSPSVADIFFILFYIFAVAGLLHIPAKAKLRREELLMLALDLGVVVFGSAIVFLVYVFRPLLTQAATPTIALFFGALYPLLDLIMLWVTAWVLLRRRHLARQIPIVWITFGAIAMAFRDVLFNYHAFTTELPGGGWADLVHGVSLFAFTIASVAQANATRAAAQKAHTAQAKPHVVAGRDDESLSIYSMIRNTGNRSIFTYLHFPYLWAWLGYTVLMALHVSTYPDADKPTPFNFVVIGVGIIILLVTLRQPLTFRENEKLSDNLAQVLDAARVLSSPLDQRTIFNVILDKLKYIVEFDNAAILLLQGTDHVLAMRYDALSSTNSAAGTLPLAPEHRAVIRTGKPSILNGKGIEETSWLGVPLIAQNGVIGLISIQRFKSEFYSQRHAEMALAFACQAAAAIENARLRNREAEAATTAERRRLSRELHDSVSQALFGIALSARSIQEFLKRDPKRASETLDYLLNLTEGALAEMRALIFELRPESLATEGLLAALQKQVLVLCTRHNINAVFRFECEEPPLPIEMKEAIYRVALEALQNTIKHAQATEVEIQFDYNPRGIRLELHDNGRGFNTSGSFPDHYGLIGMRERATNFGGTIDIRSAPGKGTHVYLMIPLTSNIFASHQPLLAEAYGHGAITPPKGTPAIRIGTAKEVVRSSTALRGQTKLPVNKN